MTIEDISRRIENIKSISGDPESAHSTEDDMYIRVLFAISRGECQDPAGCAREALKARDIEFPRWYA